MRAAKWKLDDAKKRLKGTLEWRREYKPDLIPPDEVGSSLFSLLIIWSVLLKGSYFVCRSRLKARRARCKSVDLLPLFCQE